MAVGAYILINVESGKINQVLKALKELAEVQEAYPVTGDYDAIVQIEAEELDDIHQLVAEKIHCIEGVKRTRTHVILE